MCYFLERTLLLKKAKEEANGEVEAYKNERERLFKSLEQQVADFLKKFSIDFE